MKKIFISLVAAAILLSTATASLSLSQIRILAPAEESFLGLDGLLIIGRVEEGENGTTVEIRDNGKVLGVAPLKGNTFTYHAELDEGRHEIVFSISGVESKAIKVFVGRQEGYRYHIARDGSSCPTCHQEASLNKFTVGHLQVDMCSRCHDPIGNSDYYVHGPVAAGSCTPCHDPHGSRYEKFLVATGKELCLVCHSQNLSMKHVGERQNADCVKCHDPHSSSLNYMLR